VRLYSIIFAWFVLLAGIPSSIYLFTFARDSVEHVAQSQFEREARYVHRDIDDQIRAYTEMLYALRAVFSHDGAVDRLRFHRFVDSLDSKRRYPAVVSVNYSSYVAAKDKADFENLVRADATLDSRGYPDFSIKTSGNRSEYFVLNYLEPLAGNEHLFGTDLGAGIPIVSAPQKAVRAIYSGRDSGKPTASASPVHLPGVNEPAEAVYLALRLAVYRVGMPVDTVELRRIAYVGSVGVILDVRWCPCESACSTRGLPTANPFRSRKEPGSWCLML
jgi:CHASE1-domain containing sensor protein